jgi:MFS family permease
MMITGLVLQAGDLLLMTQATSISSWLVLMAAMGVSPLFSIGGNAMVADLLPNHQRAQAYALLRMVINLGVVTGPLLGGWIIAEHSFQTAFWTAASLLLFLAGLAPTGSCRKPDPRPRKTLLSRTKVSGRIATSSQFCCSILSP